MADDNSGLSTEELEKKDDKEMRRRKRMWKMVMMQMQLTREMVQNDLLTTKFLSIIDNFIHSFTI